MTRRSPVLTLALILMAAALGLYTAGWSLSRPVPARIGAAPASLAAEAITFSSESGSQIHGWLSRSTGERGIVLLLPGVRGNRLSMVRRAEFLRQAGYATLLIDFQATGESPGDAITFGWRERLDVMAAVRYIETRVPNLRIGIIGQSLGGAATLLATPPLEIDAVVLESVYPTIDRAIRNRLSKRIGPLAPAVAPLLSAQLRPRLGISSSALRPVDHIGQLHCPVLVIAGSGDHHTTAEDTQLLFAAAREPKQLWMIPGAAHVDYLEYSGADYRHRVLEFLATALH
jgi:uncharacterized protein